MNQPSLKPQGHSFGQAFLKRSTETELDVGIQQVEELLFGQSEWRNISDVIRQTIKALTEVVKSQGKRIRDLERVISKGTGVSNPGSMILTSKNENKNRGQSMKVGGSKDQVERRLDDVLSRTKQMVDKYNPSDRYPPQDDDDQFQQEDSITISDINIKAADGYTYKGQGILPNIRQGFGVLLDPNDKEVYSGYWKNNQYQGEGKLTNQQQEPMQGALDWNNMTAINNGWETYEGEFHHGAMDGQGILTLTNGEKYIGQFQNGMIHGQGTFIDFFKNVVKGVWENGYFVQLSL